MKIEIFDCAQGTDEWHEARRGIVTASEFKSVLAKGEGKTRRKYMCTLVGERLAGRVEPGYSNQYMDRGHQDESTLIAEYEAITGEMVTPCGFIRRDDYGCSPDGLVGDDGLIEGKTKNYDLHIECIESGKVPSGHIAQVQGALWVTGRKWLDFISFSRGLPPFIKRVYPDPEYHTNLETELGKFVSELKAMCTRIQEFGNARISAKEA